MLAILISACYDTDIKGEKNMTNNKFDEKVLETLGYALNAPEIVKDEKFQSALEIILGEKQADINPINLFAAIDSTIRSSDKDPISRLCCGHIKTIRVDMQNRTISLFSEKDNRVKEPYTPFNITLTGSKDGKTIQIDNKCTVIDDFGRKIVCDIPETFTMTENGVESEKKEKSLFYNENPKKNPKPIGIINNNIDAGSSAAASMEKMIESTGWKIQKSAEGISDYIQLVQQHSIRTGTDKKLSQDNLIMYVLKDPNQWLLCIDRVIGNECADEEPVRICYSTNSSELSMYSVTDTGNQITYTGKHYRHEHDEKWIPCVKYAKNEETKIKSKQITQQVDHFEKE